jgi:hypothetical protein
MSGNDAAFPGEKNIRYGQPNDCNEGLTKREYFAGLAMQGILAGQYSTGAADWNAGCDTLAGWSVDIADALLAELEKSP